MKKIAYCLLSDGMGGAENIVLQTLGHFRNDVRFYLIVNNELMMNFCDVLPPERIINIGDIYIHKKYKFFRYVLNNRFYNLRRFIIKFKVNHLKETLIQNEIEIVHAHLDYALYLALHLKQLFPQLKVVFTVHSAFGFLKSKELKPQLSFNHIDFTKIESFIFVSKYVYEIYKSNIPIKHFEIIYNGIDNISIKQIKRAYILSDSFNLLYLGGEKLVKGYDILVDTIELLVARKRDINLKVFVLGTVGERGNLFQLIENKKLQRYFDVIGFTNHNELLCFFEKSHLLFMPSRTEAMPLAAIEAVFYNLPIIATNVGGIPEIVSSEKNGYCCNLNPIDFAKVIEESKHNYNLLLNNTLVYNELIHSKFTLKYMCESLLHYYSDMNKVHI